MAQTDIQFSILKAEADGMSASVTNALDLKLRQVFDRNGAGAAYGHENEMYKEPMNLKRGKGVYMRELRECGGRTEDKTKCAKG